MSVEAELGAGEREIRCDIMVSFGKASSCLLKTDRVCDEVRDYLATEEV